MKGHFWVYSDFYSNLILQGCRHGVEKDVYMSLPCVLGGGGVEFIVRQSLCEKEKELLQQSADSMNEMQKNLDILSADK